VRDRDAPLIAFGEPAVESRPPAGSLGAAQVLADRDDAVEPILVRRGVRQLDADRSRDRRRRLAHLVVDLPAQRAGAVLQHLAGELLSFT
jgi:hypothetical protein